MELKKTTILSAFVVVAGILAEIIFRDVLSKSMEGVVLSVILAVIVLVSFYFATDGIYYMANTARDRDRQDQRDFEQRIIGVLNEQLKFQKIIYNEVHTLYQSDSERQENIEAVPKEAAQAEPAVMPMGISDEDVEKIVLALIEYLPESTPVSTGLTKENIGEIVDAVKEQISKNEPEAFSISDEDIDRIQTAVAANIVQPEPVSSGISDEDIDRIQTAVTANIVQPEPVSSGISDEDIDRIQTAVTANIVQPEPVSSDIPDEDIERIVKAVGDNTMQAAKVIARYIAKSSEEIKKLVIESKA